MSDQLVLTSPEPRSLTPSDLLQLAISQDADIEKLEKLMQLQQQWLAAQSKRAFDIAKSRFLGMAINVTKDKTNTQYGSRYTTLGNLVKTVTPFLAQCGLGASWEIDQSGDKIKVTCVLAHQEGHEQRVSFAVPPDTSGAKNPIQQIKSAITYARAVTFEAVCGLTGTEEATLDDDGNAAGKFADVQERLEWIENCTNVEELKRVFQEAFTEAKKVKDTHAMKVLADAKNKQYRQIVGAA